MRLITVTLLTVLWTFLPAWAQADFHYPVPAGTLDTEFYSRSFSTEPFAQPAAQTVRNVILCIGDGMGFGQVTLARIRTLGLNGRLAMERCPVHGSVWTFAANALVTDSAAAGTALACGVKTENGRIGQDPHGAAWTSLRELCRRRGMPTGVVVTSTITHATPAAFYAHVRRRSDEATIAEQLLAAHVTVALGGGRQFFLPKSHPDSKRRDDLDLLAAAQKQGYHIVTDAQQLWAARQVPLLGLFQAGPLTTEHPEPSLAELTDKALSLLQRQSVKARRGFFLMVEGSQIDWACHANETDSMIRQTLLFDQAIQTAVEFVQKHPRTLLIITADHETGGLTLGQGDDPYDAKVQWASKNHTALPVPLYALGPGSERFAGLQDNTEIPRRLADLLSLGSFPKPLPDNR